MSYQVLARRWRPKSFADMVGQQHVLKTLRYALEQDRLHHAYLFSGTRGVGKTTLARVLAKCLNCEQGIHPDPCGACTACIEIDEGRFVDLIEVDAASRAKVEETRELMENVQYASTIGRYKIYLIDEVHMFSNHSFNALLKTLEEPPPHVVFLLATTEPKKLPITVLSRCLHFALRPLTVSQIHQQLSKILKAESIASDDASLHLLAQAAQGSLRDALSLLDQAIAYGGGRIEQELVRPMLGTVGSDLLDILLTILLERKVQALPELIERIASFNPDYDALLVELLALLQRAARVQLLGDAETDLEKVHPLVQDLAAQLEPEVLQLFYQIILTGRQDLMFAPDPKCGFEMLLIRMLVFKPGTEGMFAAPTDQPLPSDFPEGQSGEKGQDKASMKASDVAPPAKTSSDRVSPDRPSAGDRPVTVEGAHSTPVPDAVRAVDRDVHVSPAGGEEGQQADRHRQDKRPSPGSAMTKWQAIIEGLSIVGLVKELANHCVMESHTLEGIELSLHPSNACLLNPVNQKRLEEALKKHLGEGMRVTITLKALDVETPAQATIRQQEERRLAMVDRLEQDDLVQALTDTFNGVLDKDSVEIK